MFDLLSCQTEDEQEALALLERAFRSKNFDALYKVLGTPVHSMAQAVTNFGVAERFSWLTGNLTAIREQLQLSIRKQVMFGFEAAFGDKLAAEKPKILEVTDLTAALRDNTTDANHCAPESFKHQDP
jgi:hypothetical protein